MFKKSSVAAAIGTAFLASMTLGVASAADNPFHASGVTGVQVAGHEGKCGEGKCGEGKCGAAAFKKMDKDGDGKLTMDEFMAGHKAAEGKCGEGKCGAAKKGATPATPASDAKKMEGKCGEGKCGGDKKPQ